MNNRLIGYASKQLKRRIVAWPEKMPRSGCGCFVKPSVLLRHDGSLRADDTLKYACAAADGFGWIPRIDRPVVVALLA